MDPDITMPSGARPIDVTGIKYRWRARDGVLTVWLLSDHLCWEAPLEEALADGIEGAPVSAAAVIDWIQLLEWVRALDRDGVQTRAIAWERVRRAR